MIIKLDHTRNCSMANDNWSFFLTAVFGYVRFLHHNCKKPYFGGTIVSYPTGIPQLLYQVATRAVQVSCALFATIAILVIATHQHQQVSVSLSSYHHILVVSKVRIVSIHQFDQHRNWGILETRTNIVGSANHYPAMHLRLTGLYALSVGSPILVGALFFNVCANFYKCYHEPLLAVQPQLRNHE